MFYAYISVKIYLAQTRFTYKMYAGSAGFGSTLLSITKSVSVEDLQVACHFHIQSTKSYNDIKIAFAVMRPMLFVSLSVHLASAVQFVHTGF